MTDWKTLEAGRELDRLIAERLGWIGVRVHGYAAISRESEKRLSEVRLDELIGHPPDKEREYLYETVVPRYSTSVDAALTLLQEGPGHEVPMWETAYLGGERYLARVERMTNDVRGVARWWPSNEEAPTFALAICRAWLAWKDAQTEGEG